MSYIELMDLVRTALTQGLQQVIWRPEEVVMERLNRQNVENGSVQI